MCWLNFHVWSVSWWLKHPPLILLATVLGIITALLNSALSRTCPKPQWKLINCVRVPLSSSWLWPRFSGWVFHQFRVTLMGNIRTSYWRAFKPGRVLGVCYNLQTIPDLLTDGKGKKEDSWRVKWEYHWNVDSDGKTNNIRQMRIPNNLGIPQHGFQDEPLEAKTGVPFIEEAAYFRSNLNCWSGWVKLLLSPLIDVIWCDWVH